MSSSKMTLRTFFSVFFYDICVKKNQKPKQTQSKTKNPKYFRTKCHYHKLFLTFNYNARIWTMLMHQYEIFLLSQIFHQESLWWVCHAQCWCSENWVFLRTDSLCLFFLPSCPNRNVRKQRWLSTCHVSDLLHDWLEIPWITGNVKLLFSLWRYYLNKWCFKTFLESILI